MNVLAAPFLYTMPTQIEAFACFSAFIERCCPLYVQPTLVGVHSALKVSRSDLGSSCCPMCSRQLVDKCLERINKPLYDHLRSKNLSAEIYAFPCRWPLWAGMKAADKIAILTLCACTPPLDEVLQLWE
jgi:cell cycle arrest protein BUB2